MGTILQEIHRKPRIDATLMIKELRLLLLLVLLVSLLSLLSLSVFGRRFLLNLLSLLSGLGLLLGLVLVLLLLLLSLLGVKESKEIGSLFRVRFRFELVVIIRVLLSSGLRGRLRSLSGLSSLNRLRSSLGGRSRSIIRIRVR